MSSLTDTAENAVLNWITGNTVTAPVGPLKLHYFSTAPTDAAAGTEASDSGYAAPTVTLAAASGGSTTNSNAPETLMPAGTWTHAEVRDSNGVRWLHGALTTPRTTLAGDTLRLPAGTLVLTAG